MPSKGPKQPPSVPGIDPFDLSKVAMASSLEWLAREHVSAVDVAMRSNYDLLRARVVSSLRPVLVVQFDFSGGTYNLLTDGGQETIQPVPRIFEQVKSICHCPLGIFTILAPYLSAPCIDEWAPRLREFGEVLTKAVAGLEHVGFNKEVYQWSHDILTASTKFIDECVRARTFTMPGYRAYAASVFDAIRHNMEFAARIQVTAVAELLRRWKQELGTEWTNLYAVVLTTWTIEEKNQHWLVLRRMMDQTQLDQRLYVVSVGNAGENTVDVAVMNLAIIVQDKIAGHMVFGNSPPAAAQLNADLATRNDLLSSSVQRVIDEILDKPAR